MPLRGTGNSLGLGRKQIAGALDQLAEHGFIGRWERHTNGRYWRVVFDSIPSVEATATPWYSQAQISAWIDGARSMGAGTG